MMTSEEARKRDAEHAAKLEAAGLSWVSSFQGCAEFERRRRGARVAVRWFGDPRWCWNVGVWESDILPTIGCVFAHDFEFPTVEEAACFPGFIPARYVIDPAREHGELGRVRVEYRGERENRPVLYRAPWGYVVAAPWVDEQVALWGYPRSQYERLDGVRP